MKDLTQKADNKKQNKTNTDPVRSRSSPAFAYGPYLAGASTDRLISIVRDERHSPTMYAGLRQQAVMSLQRTIGNQAVQRLIKSGALQAKLKIGRPGDRYEQEADRVAGQVMAMPDPKLQRQPESEEKEETLQTKSLADQITPLVQRQEAPPEEEEETVQAKVMPGQTQDIQRQGGTNCSECEEETAQRQPMEEDKEEGLLQAKVTLGHTPQVTSNVATNIQNLTGGGQSLPEATRSFFEPRFGHDFSQVRIHTDARAASVARSINARAFTLGRDVVFGAGEYSSGNSSGRKLLSHELTHVVQQRRMRSFNSMPISGFNQPQENSERINLISPHRVNRECSVAGRSGRNDIKTAGLAPQGLIQLSPLSDELAALWQAGNKGGFFERLRNMSGADPDAIEFITNNLSGDDLWLASNLYHHGREANWPIHLRVEREMKGWGDSGGKGVVFDILRAAGGSEAGNAALTASLNRVFTAGSDDIWLAQNLQAYGVEPNWPIPVLIPPASITGEQVVFTGSHALTAYGGDPRIQPLWTRGSTNHATAYTKSSTPALDARFVVGNNLSRANIPAVSVRVKEGATVLGTSVAFPPGATSIDVAGLVLTGLSGSSDVRSSNYSLVWEASVDGGTTWGPVTSTGMHPVFWLHAAPLAAPLHNFAVAKATGYVAGAGTVAASIRTGLRGELNYSPSDPINPDPLSVYADGIGICTDFANLLTLLARSVGLAANSVMFWGGFQSLGKNIWVTLGGAYGNINLVNVRSTNPAYNVPTAPISPLGWAFNYHAISRIGGVLQDAALDIQGINAQAAHDGKVVRLLEPAAAVMPPGSVGTAYSEPIRRRDHTVGIAIRDYGTRITGATFGDVYPLVFPAAAASPYDVPVTWSVTMGALPVGLALNAATGRIHGTPTAAGTSAITIQDRAPGGTTHTFPLSITIDP